jgi:hypothetical protein
MREPGSDALLPKGALWIIAHLVADQRLHLDAEQARVQAETLKED